MKMMEEMAASTAETATTTKGLSTLTVAQLRERARALGLPGCGKMVKAALVQAIEAAETADEPGTTETEATTAATADEATLTLGRRLWRFGAWALTRGLISGAQARILEASIKEVFISTEIRTPREMAALRICHILLGVIKRLL